MNISQFKQCSDCGACYNICPKGAISVDDGGLFYVPVVDESLCVDCSRCVGVCPVNNEIGSNKPISAFGGWHKDDKVVSGSSSGGVFYGIAEDVVSHGGVVFAAVLSDDCRTVDFASSDDMPLSRMMKSKYVESRVNLSFKRVEKELDSGRRVMFVGTPCQVAGLMSYLGKDRENLITCDFACGGLPSHRIYSDYLGGLEKKYGSDIESVDFRSKSHGWKRYVIRVRFGNGKEYVRLGIEDPYLKSFLYGKCSVREYCLDCKFPEHHMSDISIADFWRHDKMSSLENKNGISLILCNTGKGRAALDAVRDRFELAELEVDKASYNNRIHISEKAKAKHSSFLKDYKSGGLKYASEKNRFVRELCGRRSKAR